MRGIVLRRAAIGIGVAAIAAGLSVVPSVAQHSQPASPGTQALLVVDGRNIGTFILPKIGAGDADFKAHGPKVVASASLVVEQKRLLATVCMHAKETTSDHTEAAGCVVNFVLFAAPAGQCISFIDVGRYEALSYQDTDNSDDEFGRQVTGSFVEHWRVVADTNGNEAGVRTGFQVSTRSFTATTFTC